MPDQLTLITTLSRIYVRALAHMHVFILALLWQFMHSVKNDVSLMQPGAPT